MAPDASKSRVEIWQDWILDRVFRVLIWIALRLPLKLRRRLAGIFVERLVAPLAGYRERAEANLTHVWPDMSPAERRRIADAAARNAGRTLIENYDIASLRSEVAISELAGEGLPHIVSAQEKGTPVLFVTGHYGNFEAPRAALVARGYEVGGLYRPMSNTFFNSHYAQNMHELSGPVFEQGLAGTKGLLRHLKTGGMAVLLFDVYDSAGAPIPFLGKPAPTLTSAAEIALKSGALLIPFFGVRRRDGVGFRCLFEAPISHGDPKDMMQEATRRLEAQIQKDPSQWFWIHRRWKPERQARRMRERYLADLDR